MATNEECIENTFLPKGKLGTLLHVTFFSPNNVISSSDYYLVTPIIESFNILKQERKGLGIYMIRSLQ